MSLYQHAIEMRPQLLKRAERFTRNPSDAEDAFQELLIRLWRTSVRQVENPARYIQATARRIYWRVCHDRPPQGITLEKVDVPTDAMDAEVARLDQEVIVARVAACLTSKHREVFVMWAIGYTPKEIAAETGSTVELTRNLIERARQIVRLKAKVLDRD